MRQSSDILVSVITPSRGDRPKALAQAGQSLDRAVARAVEAGLMSPGQVEWLVGFDGLKGERPVVETPVRFVDFPKSGNFGNLIRDRLLRLAKGSHLIFLDDDNALTENALASFLRHLDAEFVIGRVDVSRAFDAALLPRPTPPGGDGAPGASGASGASGTPEDAGTQSAAGTGGAKTPADEAVRQGNIDPLCLCLSRELVVDRGRGWGGEGGYESDFLNIRRYYQRARSVRLLDDVVGVYDAGRGLDPQGMNPRQAGK